MRATTIVFALVAAASIATWTDLFSPPYGSCPTVMIAISCVDSNTCYIPAGQSSGGFDVYTFDGQPNGAFNPLNMPDAMLMAMAIGMGGKASAPHGSVGGMGLGNGVQYASTATTFLPSSVASLFVVTQDIRATPSGMEVLVVDNGGSNAVLYSSNAGMNFTQSNINNPMPDGAFARYGSIVDTNTWYVTLGNWPSNSAPKKAGTHALSARVEMIGNKRVSHPMAARVKAASNSTGYSAVIVKTQDGGKTWETQFSSTAWFYFNAIDCSSATQCVAVGEGFDTDAAAHIYYTNDGKTWTQVLELPSTSTAQNSLMSVSYASKDLVWAAGSVQGEFSANALFYKSTDGGKTWTDASSQLQNIGDVTDLSFLADGSAGFATAVTIYDDSTVLKYTS